MGYFANGTEGQMYEEDYCDRCIHGQVHSKGDCAVWEAHMLHNYEECNKKDSILHELIPRTAEGNAQCRMFVEAEAE